MGNGMKVWLPTAVMFLALLTISACDSSDDESNEVTVEVAIDGEGSGRIQSRSSFIEIDCRIADSEVTGQCDDIFIDTDGQGVVRLQATPDLNSDFSWGTPCQGEPNLCEIPFDTEIDNSIEVAGTFEPKTVNVIMEPPSANIISAEQVILITATAVDERGGPVAGVIYEWVVDRPEILSMVPESAQSVRVSALGSGQAIVSATVQGVVGRTPVDIRLPN